MIDNLPSTETQPQIQQEENLQPPCRLLDFDRSKSRKKRARRQSLATKSTTPEFERLVQAFYQELQGNNGVGVDGFILSTIDVLFQLNQARALLAKQTTQLMKKAIEERITALETEYINLMTLEPACDEDEPDQEGRLS